MDQSHFFLLILYVPNPCMIVCKQPNVIYWCLNRKATSTDCKSRFCTFTYNILLGQSYFCLLTLYLLNPCVIVCDRLVTVVEFLNLCLVWKSKDFYIPMCIFKCFLISCKTFWVTAITNWAHFSGQSNKYMPKSTQNFENARWL